MAAHLLVAGSTSDRTAPTVTPVAVVAATVAPIVLAAFFLALVLLLGGFLPPD